MIELETRLCVNTDEIAAEVIDSETVLINLSTGAYYTMDKVGTVVWTMIENRYSLAEMSELLTSSYALEHEQALNDLRVLADELLDEGLVVAEKTAPIADSGAIDCSASGERYARPTLNKYTDMAEVLALDPPLPVLKE